jgi:arabinofuranan 3-O-arabinosyltransferase
VNNRAVTTALWTLAILSLVYTLGRAVSHDTYQGYDIVPVWKSVHAFVDGGVIYPPHRADQFYPDFVYPPSALVLLLPLGLVGLSVAKAAVLVIDVASILIAAVLCLRLFGLRWRGWAGAATLLGLSLSWPFFSTLHTENVNGLLLLGEAIFLLTVANGRWAVAGVALGLTLALKPVLAPLLLVVILYRRWRAFMIAVAIPIVLSGIVLLASPATRSFTDTTLPFLLNGEDKRVQAVSVSLQSVAARLSVPHPLSLAIQLAVLAGVAYLLWRRHAASPAEPRRLVELSSIALIAAFLLSSFAFQHYAVYLLPLAVSVADPQSPLRTWIGWVGLYAVATMDYWNFDRLPHSANKLLAERFTIGLLVLLFALWLGLRRESAINERRPGKNWRERGPVTSRLLRRVPIARPMVARFRDHADL